MVRHKVYVTINEYNSKGYVGETVMNAHRQRVEEVDIIVNADTEEDYNLSAVINVKPDKDTVYVNIGEGEGYVINLASFKGKIIIDNNFMTRVIADNIKNNER